MTEVFKLVRCHECAGTGKQMEMKCYGGKPIEEYINCELCEGRGDFEEDYYLILRLEGKV